jgi:hypothetical protein
VVEDGAEPPGPDVALFPIPGMTATEIRRALIAIAPQLGVHLGRVLTKPHERGEYVSYHGEGIMDWQDAPDEF